MSLNFNKLVLQGQNAAKQEQALKFLEFITEYTFKKNQYRTMNPNPILDKQYSVSECNHKSDLMAQLNAIDWKKQSEALKIKNENKDSWVSGLKLESQKQESQQQHNFLEQSKINQSKNSEISIKSHSSILQPNNIKKNLIKKESGFKKNKGENQNSRISSISDSKSNSSLNSNDFQSRNSQKQRQDLDDFQSYISSIASQKKKVISIVNQVQYEDFDSLQSPMIRKKLSKLSHKQSVAQNNNQIQDNKNSFLYLNDQQISEYLLKLQTFQIQQQILVKRINKTLNKPLNCIQKMNNLKWNDLNLPKPSCKFMNLNYGEIIQ